MTDGKDRQNESIESLLKKAHLPEPSTELKERITAKATRIWNQTLQDVPWQIPIRRLAASAAAAVFIIWLSNISSDVFVARWQTGGASAQPQQLSEVDVLSDMPYDPFVRHLASTGREYPVRDASGLRHYVETCRRLLDEIQQNQDSQLPVPFEGSSRLLPKRSNLNAYS